MEHALLLHPRVSAEGRSTELCSTPLVEVMGAEHFCYDTPSLLYIFPNPNNAFLSSRILGRSILLQRPSPELLVPSGTEREKHKHNEQTTRRRQQTKKQTKQPFYPIFLYLYNMSMHISAEASAIYT